MPPKDKRLERAKARERYLREHGNLKAEARDRLLQEDIRNIERGLVPVDEATIDRLQYQVDTKNTIDEMRRAADKGDALVQGDIAAVIDAETKTTVAAVDTGLPRLSAAEAAAAEASARAQKVAAMEGMSSKIAETRKSLPIYQYRSDLIHLVRNNQVVVVIGETGSGKTTQILQYLREDGLTQPKWWMDGEAKADEDDPPFLKIACTQPRRIAAISVAERVAVEAGVRCGREVGYKVRFDDKTSQATEIVYLTDGMMLKELANDPTLDNFSVIMVDEAHERSLQSDILLGLLKDLCRQRPNIRVIVASATLEAAKFQKFFNNSPLFTIKGRTFPVETLYSEAPVEDYVLASAETTVQLHLEKELPGDVLIFLPGQDDIERCADMLRAFQEEMKDEIRPLVINPIYSTLPPAEQKRIYAPTPEGHRKVVIATNIAETSITVDGVVYVIDCGLAKEKRFNPISMMEELTVVPTSQASAEQRKGRAGRTRPGLAMRLYTKYMFDNELQKETTPEILRSNLSSVVMNLFSIGVHNLHDFDFLDIPSREALAGALDHLHTLGAIDDAGALTPDLGRQMSEFPLEPSLAKMVLEGTKRGVTQQVCIAAAMLSVQNSMFLPARGEAERKAHNGIRERLYGEECSGDVIGNVRTFEQWQATRYTDHWCTSHRINVKTMNRAREIRDQILGTCERLGLDLGLGAPGGPEVPKTKQAIEEAVTRCLCAGFFTNVAKLSVDCQSYTVVRPLGAVSADGRPLAMPAVEIHPSSCIARQDPRPDLVLFGELRHTSKPFMMNLTAVTDPLWLMEAAPGHFTENDVVPRNRKRKR